MTENVAHSALSFGYEKKRFCMSSISGPVAAIASHVQGVGDKRKYPTDAYQNQRP
jgi:hypothetical protein